MDQLQNLLNFTVFQWQGTPITLAKLVIGPLSLLALWLIYIWIDRTIRRQLVKRDVSADLIHLIRRVFLILVIVATGITILEILNVPLTAFAFVSGAIAIGVGFGAQNIINNFISGWILMWERPIRIGDFLEIDDTRGTVEAINTRSTRIRRIDGVHMLVPNSLLLENTVVNWTLVDRLVRTEVSVGVAYGSPVEKVRDLLQQALDENTDIEEQPATLILFNDFGDSSLVFDVIFWVTTDSTRDLRKVRSDLRFQITRLFIDNSIEIAFPQRDVHLDSRSPLSVRIVSEAEDAKTAEEPGTHA